MNEDTDSCCKKNETDMNYLHILSIVMENFYHRIMIDMYAVQCYSRDSVEHYMVDQFSLSSAECYLVSLFYDYIKYKQKR